MNPERRQTKTLLIASASRLDEMLRKGNVWYIRHYEAFFDRVYVAYITGAPHVPVRRGNTTLVSLGTGRGSKIDLALAPYALYRLAKKINPTSYVTADLVYSWWTLGLVKLLLGASVFLTPVCIPELIYQNTGKSMSGLFPIWFERVCVLLAFRLADKVVTPARERGAGDFYDWILAYPMAREKAVVVDPVVDDLPSTDFYESLQLADRHRSRSGRATTVLVYVGRLSKDKLVEDLVRMMASIKRLNATGLPLRLDMIGNGPERTHLKDLCDELGVQDLIRFAGTVASVDLPKRLLASDIFLSPYTGTALREAALCGLPIVAYDMDWVHGVFEHKETALLVPPRDYEEMAKQVILLLKDAKLRRKLSQNVEALAWRFWSPQELRASLQQAFGGIH